MPTISFTVSVAAANELNAAFGEGYQATLPNGQPNPETQAQFSRRQLIAWMKHHVMQYRRRVAAEAAAASDPDIT